MTILERKRQKQQKIAARKKPPMVLGEPWRFIKQYKGNRMWKGRNRRKNHPPTGEPLEPLEIDIYTYRIMKAEVLHRIHQAEIRSCTLFDAIAAIKSSQDVFDTFQDAKMGWSVRALWNLVSTEEARRAKRRYQLMGALDQLEAQPSASEYRVSSWEDVEDACRSVLSFPDESQQQLAQETTASLSEPDNNMVKKFVKRLELEQQKKMAQRLAESTQAWQEIERRPLSSEREWDKADKFLLETVAEATERRRQRLTGAAPEDEFGAAAEGRLLREDREAEAQERASRLLRDLTPEEEELVQDALYKSGPDDDVVARMGTDVVTRKTIGTLQPGAWLNDEIIHFFLATLAKRDEELCNKDSTRKRSHFFKSFFMTKLTNEGHINPAIAGVYEYRNVKRWSKNVPGKDIFNLDKIIFPINVGEVHWVCAVAFMQEKRIQYYDSFGGDGMAYLESIMRYIKDEHQDKKKSPLPDEDEWQLIPCERNTPRQRNGYDCGVFTCMFADFISKDCPLVFNQDHVNQCRERIALSILQGRAIL